MTTIARSPDACMIAVEVTSMSLPQNPPIGIPDIPLGGGDGDDDEVEVEVEEVDE
jgi:hypothetical protein